MHFICLKCKRIMEGTMDSIEKLCDEVGTVNGFCYLGDRLNSFIHAYELMLGLHVFRQTGPPRRVDCLAPPSVCHIKTKASR